MKRLLLATTFLLTMPAFAQSATMQSPAYQECTTLASTNPSQALAKADAWLQIDNGLAAQHCRAMALYGLRRYPEAADALNTVRNAIALENMSLRGYVTRQAVRAYINASQADKALGLINAEIAEIGITRGDNAGGARLAADLLLDRARLNQTYGKLEEAAKDLDHAVSLAPVNQEVLLERASVFEKLGDPALAKADVDAVLVINSGNSQARLMRDRLTGARAVIATPSNMVAAPAPAPASVYAMPTNPASAAPVTQVLATPNPQDTSTLVAPTPLLASSSSANPQEGMAANSASTSRMSKKSKKNRAALTGTIDNQTP